MARWLSIVIMLYLLACQPTQRHVPVVVMVEGAMRDVMWEGELAGKVSVDTLHPRATLYGLGPAEHLQGEVMVLAGKAYRSQVQPDSSMVVEIRDDVHPPFFVYAHTATWDTLSLPDTVIDLPTLEQYLTDAVDKGKPFVFRLLGTIDTAHIHVQNLTPGAVVSSPKEAHAGQVDYTLVERVGELLGFYSTQHQGVYTHHDTYLHLHFMTKDQTAMGHLDVGQWSAGQMRLLVGKSAN